MKTARQIFAYINVGRRANDRSGRCIVARYSKRRHRWIAVQTLYLN